MRLERLLELRLGSIFAVLAVAGFATPAASLTIHSTISTMTVQAKAQEDGIVPESPLFTNDDINSGTTSASTSVSAQTASATGSASGSLNIGIAGQTITFQGGGTVSASRTTSPGPFASGAASGQFTVEFSVDGPAMFFVDSASGTSTNTGHTVGNWGLSLQSKTGIVWNSVCNVGVSQDTCAGGVQLTSNPTYRVIAGFNGGTNVGPFGIGDPTTISPFVYGMSASMSIVPEPTAALLLAVGLVGLGVYGGRRQH
jgi:hypothetical protein